MRRTVDFNLNGSNRKLEVETERSLLQILREELDLTGTKYGCGEGQCGACTVLIDGEAVRSCLTSAGSVHGKQVTTIEGLGSNDKLHPLQEAFLEVDAMQCGYCITGMIMSAAGLLKRTPRPSRAEIVRFMEGNICRCGSYPLILSAIQKAAGEEEVR